MFWINCFYFRQSVTFTQFTSHHFPIEIDRDHTRLRPSSICYVPETNLRLINTRHVFLLARRLRTSYNAVLKQFVSSLCNCIVVLTFTLTLTFIVTSHVKLSAIKFIIVCNTYEYKALVTIYIICYGIMTGILRKHDVNVVFRCRFLVGVN